MILDEAKPVRAGEELDTGKLAAYLEREVGAGAITRGARS